MDVGGGVGLHNNSKELFICFKLLKLYAVKALENLSFANRSQSVTSSFMPYR